MASEVVQKRWPNTKRNHIWLWTKYIWGAITWRIWLWSSSSDDLIMRTLSEDYIWRLYKEISKDSNSGDSDHAHLTLTHAQKHIIRCHLVRNLRWKHSICNTILLRKHLIMLLVFYRRYKEFTTFVSHSWHEIFIDFPQRYYLKCYIRTSSQLAKTTTLIQQLYHTNFHQSNKEQLTLCILWLFLHHFYYKKKFPYKSCCSILCGYLSLFLNYVYTAYLEASSVVIFVIVFDSSSYLFRSVDLRGIKYYWTLRRTL